MTPEGICASINAATNMPKSRDRRSVTVHLADGALIGLHRLGVGYELRIAMPDGRTRVGTVWGRRVRASPIWEPSGPGRAEIEVGDPKSDGFLVRGSVTLHPGDVERVEVLE